MSRLRKRVFIGLGWALVAAGVVIAPLPGPGGVPVIAAGTYVLVRNSFGARRIYVRVKRRWPAAMAPVDRFMRRRRPRPASS